MTGDYEVPKIDENALQVVAHKRQFEEVRLIQVSMPVEDIAAFINMFEPKSQPSIERPLLPRGRLEPGDRCRS